mgnify:CR=1 FL=1
MDKIRCKWANHGPELMAYHDYEYGIRISSDFLYFERLTLEIFQAGLSWATILKKREAFREAFDNFDFYKIAKYDENKIIQLLNNKEIIRNRLKIEATIFNANQFINIVKKYGSFDNYITNLNNNYNKEDLLKIFKKEFKFMGKLILEEFMMSTGLWPVKHDEQCFLYKR